MWNGKYVVVGRNGYVGMSTDGENWNISQIDDNLSCLSIAYGNNMFIVVGNTISTPTVPKSYVLKMVVMNGLNLNIVQQILLLNQLLIVSMQTDLLVLEVI